MKSSLHILALVLLLCSFSQDSFKTEQLRYSRVREAYIHGSCVTIGCIPITDPKIKELYIFCVEARNNGQLKIPVTIFPARMDTRA